METDICTRCGHERLYHQGSHRNAFNLLACGVTYCRCSGFTEAS